MAKAWRSVVCYYSALQGLVLTSLVNEAAAAAQESHATAATAPGSEICSRDAATESNPGQSVPVPFMTIPAKDRELVRGLSRGLSRGYSMSSSDVSPDLDENLNTDELGVLNAWDLMRKAEAMAVESLDLLHETGEDLTIPRMTLEHMRRYVLCAHLCCCIPQQLSIMTVTCACFGLDSARFLSQI